jgi:hypothetical protein
MTGTDSTAVQPSRSGIQAFRRPVDTVDRVVTWIGLSTAQRVIRVLETGDPEAGTIRVRVEFDDAGGVDVELDAPLKR